VSKHGNPYAWNYINLCFYRLPLSQSSRYMLRHNVAMERATITAIVHNRKNANCYIQSEKLIKQLDD